MKRIFHSHTSLHLIKIMALSIVHCQTWSSEHRFKNQARMAHVDKPVTSHQVESELTSRHAHRLQSNVEH